MGFMARHIKKTPNFQTSVFADLDSDDVHRLLDNYLLCNHAHLVFNIEPRIRQEGEPISAVKKYSVLIFAGRNPASIKDIIKEFKKLLPYHKPEK